MAFGAHQYHQTPLWVAAENDTVLPSEIQVQVLQGNTKAQASWRASPSSSIACSCACMVNSRPVGAVAAL